MQLYTSNLKHENQQSFCQVHDPSGQVLRHGTKKTAHMHFIASRSSSGDARTAQLELCVQGFVYDVT